MGSAGGESIEEIEFYLNKRPTHEVHAYLQGGEVYKFPARNKNHARQIAGRIVNEYLYVIQEDGTEEYYPPDKIYKVKIIPMPVDTVKTDSDQGHKPL